MVNYSPSIWWVLLVGAACYQTLIQAQLFEFGNCPEKNPVADFKLSEYTGKWYENRKTISRLQNRMAQRCTIVLFNETEGQITVQNRGLQRVTGRNVLLSGTVRHPDPSKGEFVVNYLGNASYTDESLMILGTDYDSYSVSLSCMNVGPMHLYTLWVHTREPNPSSETIALALDVVKQSALDEKKLLMTNRRNC